MRNMLYSAYSKASWDLLAIFQRIDGLKNKKRSSSWFIAGQHKKVPCKYTLL